MPLIRLNEVSIAFGTHALLDKADFQLDSGERVGLIGRNGEGKSTLLKLIAGKLAPDGGEIWRQAGLRIAVLEQAPSLPEQATIYDAVADGLGEVGHWIAEYHAISAQLESGDSERMAQLGRLQQQLESHDGWNLQQRVETILSRLNLPADKAVAGLSGGWQRRVALARALVLNPDLLLLDEPTNHLDLESIGWLEEQLLNNSCTLLFVTHDRAFLQNLATRIIDLDRGQLVSWPGDYRNYLEKKAAALEEEARHNAEFDKKLAQEETWIRQGIKARRTRNEGRVRALKKLREERAQRRNRLGTAKITLERGEQSGKRVIEAEHICHAYHGKTVIDDFSTTILRGDKIGLIGPNGAGKSTLLRILLGQLQPDSGRVQLGTNLTVAYFDQLREQLDPQQTVVDAVGDGAEFIEINGRRQHVMSYLADFLFSPARARSPLSSLSGGEKNRVFLARLFSQPANLLVMDEPTNDLDLETLELLEDLLVNFDGTLLLVSHDRVFLDNVVSSTLVFEGEGRIQEYVGGYEDWLRQRTPELEEKKLRPAAEKPKPAAKPKRKLSYKDQRELEQLPAEIEAMEARQEQLNGQISAVDFYQQDPAAVAETLEELKTLGEQLEQSYARWDALEALQAETE